MTIRVVRLGTPRSKDEGVRIGTVRRPPRGVPKGRFASGNWYDVWLPELAPQPETVRLALGSKTAAEWNRFEKRYRAEMAKPEPQHVLELLAKLSKKSNFSVGCYCDDESRCHRSVLRQLLAQKGAEID